MGETKNMGISVFKCDSTIALPMIHVALKLRNNITDRTSFQTGFRVSDGDTVAC